MKQAKRQAYKSDGQHHFAKTSSPPPAIPVIIRTILLLAFLFLYSRSIIQPPSHGFINSAKTVVVRGLQKNDAHG